MTDLSPATQAVFDASRKYATQAWNDGTRQRFNLSIVAALRAAADQLTSAKAMLQLLAIAAELEGVNEL